MTSIGDELEKLSSQAKKIIAHTPQRVTMMMTPSLSSSSSSCRRSLWRCIDSTNTRITTAMITSAATTTTNAITTNAVRRMSRMLIIHVRDETDVLLLANNNDTALNRSPPHRNANVKRRQLQHHQRRYYHVTVNNNNNNNNNNRPYHHQYHSNPADQEQAIYQDTRFLFHLTEQVDTIPLGTFLDQFVAAFSSSSNTAATATHQNNNNNNNNNNEAGKTALEQWVGWWMTRHAMKDVLVLPQQQPQEPFSLYGSSSSSSSLQTVLPEWFLIQTFCILNRLIEEMKWYYQTEIVPQNQDDDDDEYDVDENNVQVYSASINHWADIFRAVFYPWLDAWKQHHQQAQQHQHHQQHHQHQPSSVVIVVVPPDDLIEVWNTLLQYETLIRNVTNAIRTNTTTNHHNHNNNNNNNLLAESYGSYWPIPGFVFDTLFEMAVSSLAATTTTTSTSSSSSLEPNHNSQQQQQQQQLLELVDAMINFLMERQRRSSSSSTTKGHDDQPHQQQQQHNTLLGPTWRTFHTAMQAWISSIPQDISSSSSSSSAMLGGSSSSSVWTHDRPMTPHTLAALHRAESLYQQMLETLLRIDHD